MEGPFFSLVTLIMTYYLVDMVMSKKRHIGPCIWVTEPEHCPDPDYVQVYLYTRENTENGQIIEFSHTSDNLASTKFNPKNPNTLIIHGFNTNMNLKVLQDIKTEYLKSADMNIWMANYPKLVHSGWCYVAAVANIRHVGKCLAQFVVVLRRHKSYDIHVVGFSLGAQVTNFLAKHLGEQKLNRITGLDPAGPGFSLMSNSKRLDAGDAKFVDVVHTNGGIQGDIQRCGHIDFYMNGGTTQPGCSGNKKNSLNCNHQRAVQYFAESINSKVGFYGWKCEGITDYLRGKCKPNKNLVLMGEHCPIGSSGVYIVKTASKDPFSLGNSIK